MMAAPGASDAASSSTQNAAVVDSDPVIFAGPHPIEFPSPADKVIAGLSTHGAANLDALCAKPGTDGLTSTTALCATPRPSITSLADLRAVLKLAFTDGNTGGRRRAGGNAGNGTGGNPGFALLGHSSSLVVKSVNEINPRSIVFTPNVTTAAPSTPYSILSFTRGESFAEVATYDPPNNKVNFYLVAFKKACHVAGNCTAGDLLSADVEKDWVEVSVFEDDSHGDELGNTILDCQHCHQPNGPSENAILRMQEITNPFTHFFSNDTAGGKTLLNAYFNAHNSSEPYAGIPGQLIDQSDPSLLAKLVTSAGFGTQPNAFPSATIFNELNAQGNSPTWLGLYNSFVQGLFIPPPYYQNSIADPAKLAVMTKDLRDFNLGRLPAASLPDIRDVFPTDAKFLSEAGFHIKDGLDPKGMLVNACGQCHNSRLDQNISRANFNVEFVDQMPASERSIAIGRILSAPSDPHIMPPTQFRSLTVFQKQTLVSYLSDGLVMPTSPSPGTLDGASLYTMNCAGCHGPLATSQKLGRSADQITAAIQSVPAMAGLISLTAAEKSAIAQAMGGAP